MEGQHSDDAGAEWLSGEFTRTPRLSLGFHLQVGLDEWVNLQPNGHLCDVLTAIRCPTGNSPVVTTAPAGANRWPQDLSTYYGNSMTSGGIAGRVAVVTGACRRRGC